MNCRDDFRDFAEVCLREFGDRVKHWITLNEQYIFTVHGYVVGDLAPGRYSELQPSDSCIDGDSGTEPYLVGHNLILAHAAAVKVYKTKYQVRQRGVIGIPLVTEWFVPYSRSWADRGATSRSIEFSLGWFLHPLVYGDYPPIMRELLKDRLPNFTEEDTISITQSFDFLGLNYYTSSYAKDDPSPPGPNFNYYTDIRATTTSEDPFGHPICPRINAPSWLADCPRGLKELLIHIKHRYKNPIIYITENGYFDYDSPRVHEMINDNARINYCQGHLYFLLEAMREEGVQVKGYFAWSLMDNFEWSSGYTIRFGLTYVDFKNNLKRIPKASAEWFKIFLCNGRKAHQQFEDY